MSLTFMTSDSFMKYRYYSRNLTLISQQIRAFKLNNNSTQWLSIFFQNKRLTYTKMPTSGSIQWYYFGYRNG